MGRCRRARSPRRITAIARSASATQISARCLMRMGLPYDSEEGFGWCGAITSLHDRRRLSHFGGDGAAARTRSRASKRTASRCCA